MKNKEIIEQLREGVNIPEVKLSKIELKEAVNYVFRVLPREKAAKGEGEFIQVFENEDSLSFSLKSSGSHRFTTGLRGFLNMLDIEGGWVYRTLPIVYNGIVLDDKQTEEFWEQTNKKKGEK